MKILVKRGFQQIAIDHSSDVKYFIILYKKCTANPFHVLFNDTTRELDNLLCSRSNLYERI